MFASPHTRAEGAGLPEANSDTTPSVTGQPRGAVTACMMHMMRTTYPWSRWRRHCRCLPWSRHHPSLTRPLGRKAIPRTPQPPAPPPPASLRTSPPAHAHPSVSVGNVSDMVPAKSVRPTRLSLRHPLPVVKRRTNEPRTVEVCVVRDACGALCGRAVVGIEP